MTKSAPAAVTRSRRAASASLGLAHQAGTEPSVLHPIGGAADVEVDLVIAEFGTDPCRSSQVVGIAAAELHRDRVLDVVEPEQPGPRPMDHRACGDHLRIEQSPPREQPVKGAAMPVGPVHHRCNGEAAGAP